MDERTIFTHHALKRMRQRGCDADDVNAAIAYGRMFHRQGFEFYCVAAKDMRGNVHPAQLDQLKNLVVVCREGVVVTTYRNRDSFKNVRKKGKRLMRGGCRTA